MGNIVHERNFIKADDCQKIIDFIDGNISKFAYNKERKRNMLRFGYDDELPELAITDTSILNEISKELRVIVNDTKHLAEQEASAPLHLVSMFLSKHDPGGGMRPHMDSQNIEGHNPHLDYTAMVYLNSMGRTGTLVFPIQGKRISPNVGDVVIFESKDPLNAHSVDEVSKDRYSIAIWFSKDPKHSLSI